MRQLLIDAVRTCVTDGPRTWAHLSGGLDSSSVVSTAQWLASNGVIPHGLEGTVSFIDQIGTAADERRYSDAVVAHYGVRNQQVPHQLDRWALLDDPPRFDQPGVCSYSVADRDQCVVNVVTNAGSSTLLTGSGGDNLFLGTMFFFADWVARGRISDAIREMARRAAIGRVSFWDLAYKNSVLPLIPNSLRRRLAHRLESSVPPWVNAGLVRQYHLNHRVGSGALYSGPAGSKYDFALASAVEAIPSILGSGVEPDALDIRHPYLHRPLVNWPVVCGRHVCETSRAEMGVARINARYCAGSCSHPGG